MKFILGMVLVFCLACQPSSWVQEVQEKLYGPSSWSTQKLQDKNTMPLQVDKSEEKPFENFEQVALQEVDEKSLLTRIKELSLISSKTYDAAGNLKVHQALANTLKPLGFVLEQFNLGTEYPATTLTFQGKGKLNVLLIGHSDTVLKASEIPYREDQGKIYGSGVVDMKGTLAAIVESFLALHRAQLLGNLGKVKLVISSDEEKAGQSVSKILHQELSSGEYQYFLEIEGGYEFGRIVAARKGMLVFDLEISGESAHSGNNPLKGLSVEPTVSALTQKVLRLQNLAKGTTVNLVRVPIQETVARNKIPNKAVLWVESRSFDQGELDRVRKAITAMVDDKSHRICNRHLKKCTEIQITRQGYVAPLFATGKNKKLAARFQSWSQSLNLPVKPVSSGGISDLNHGGNFPKVAAVGGLGLMGGDQHTEKEYVLKKYALQRTQMLTLALLRLSQTKR